MKKKIWLTSLDTVAPDVQGIMASLKKYGLDVDGHFWEDNLEKMAWSSPRRDLLNTDINMWLIYGNADSFAQPSILYGVSLLCLSVQATRGTNFPLAILQKGSGVIDPDSLPRHFGECAVYQETGGAWGAKIVAALHKTSPQRFPPYRLDVYGIPQVGQWIEVGPRDSIWEGAIFATSEKTISMHAVGPAGQLPEKSTLHYPQKGLKIKLGEKEFDAWAVQNKLDEKTSYYIKLDGHPEKIMFCPYSQEDEAEAFIIDLK